MSLEEISEASMSQVQPNAPPAAPPRHNGLLVQSAIAVVTALIAGGISYVAATSVQSYRNEPLTAATLQRLEARVDKIEAKQEITSSAQTRSEGQIQANRQDIESLKRTLDDIKTYQYRTSEKMNEVSAELARIGGWITRTKEEARP